MILFPLAAIWVVCVVVWAIRKGVFEAPPPPGFEPRKKSPRRPGPHGRGSAGRATRRSRRRERAAR